MVNLIEQEIKEYIKDSEDWMNAPMGPIKPKKYKAPDTMICKCGGITKTKTCPHCGRYRK